MNIYTRIYTCIIFLHIKNALILSEIHDIICINAPSINNHKPSRVFFRKKNQKQTNCYSASHHDPIFLLEISCMAVFVEHLVHLWVSVQSLTILIGSRGLALCWHKETSRQPLNDGGKGGRGKKREESEGEKGSFWFTNVMKDLFFLKHVQIEMISIFSKNVNLISIFTSFQRVDSYKGQCSLKSYFFPIHCFLYSLRTVGGIPSGLLPPPVFNSPRFLLVTTQGGISWSRKWGWKRRREECSSHHIPWLCCCLLEDTGWLLGRPFCVFSQSVPTIYLQMFFSSGWTDFVLFCLLFSITFRLWHLLLRVAFPGASRGLLCGKPCLGNLTGDCLKPGFSRHNWK